MKNKICLLYNNSSHRGPGMVVTNLLLGLEKIGVEVVENPGQADFIGCLQHPQNLLTRLPSNVLMGPNLFVVPSEDPVLCKKFQRFVVPGEWVRSLYQTFPEMQNKKIDVWSVGINTELWHPCTDISKDLDCFIYYKNRSQEDLRWVANLLKTNSLKYEIIEYGDYKETDLQSLCLRSKFAVLLTGTESQGIAYMNMLSMGLPCYVFNKSTWTYDNDPNISINASSVPYFSKKCGETIDDISVEHFRNFLTRQKSGEYSPRKYILENHTLKHSAQSYMKLLKGTKNEI